MKKFVIRTNGHGIRLSDEHLNWLYANGYNDEDVELCHNDRSHPALIACIEAVRESKKFLCNEAYRLWNIACKIKENNTSINEMLSAEIDKTLDLLDYKRYMKNRIIDEMRMVIKSGNWMDATIYANAKPGITNSELMCQFGAVVDCFSMHRKEFQTEIEAFGAYHEYCQDNNLIQSNGRFAIYDGFEIKSYDETKFVAEVRCNYAEYSYETDHEFMKLRPFLAHSTLASFVESGDTDGLFEFLKSLNVGGFMDIRDDRACSPTNNSDVAMTDEEVTKLLAEFEALAGNKV